MLLFLFESLKCKTVLCFNGHDPKPIAEYAAVVSSKDSGYIIKKRGKFFSVENLLLGNNYFRFFDVLYSLLFNHA